MEDRLLTVEEVAKKLQVSVSWVYKKCEANILRHIRIGGIRRIKESELNKWIDGHSVGGKLKV